MKYQPDPQIAKIHVRKDTYGHKIYGIPLLETWEKAHQAYRRALKMKKPRKVTGE